MASLVLVHMMLVARRAARAALPLLSALALAALIAADARSPLPAPFAIAWLVAIAALLAHRAMRRARTGHGGADTRRDVEVGALVMILAFAGVLRLDGTLEGPAYPTV